MTAPAAPGLRLVVDTANPTPPYEQLRGQLDQAIRSGLLQRGQRLPSVRQLARDLGLAVGTVARAYQELESAGLVRAARGGGTRVRDDAPVLPQQERRATLARLAAAYVRDARLLGVADAEAEVAVRVAVIDER